MADEPIAPPMTITPAAASWDVNLQSMLKALMQGQSPQAAAQAAEGSNPYLSALEESAPLSTAAKSFLEAGNLPAAAARSAGEVGAAPTKGRVPEVNKSALAQIGQMPVQNILQMGQHQINPEVEAAKQRVVQMLLQRPHGVLPQQPILKG